MDLILYHYQGLFYWLTFGLFMFRYWLNMGIYSDTDSHIIHPDVPDIWKFIPFSEKEKEEKRKLYPHIKDFSKDGSSMGSRNEESLHYAFTFWWTPEYQEDSKITKRKRIANIFHLLCLVLIVVSIILLLHMQEINFRYRNIKRDWLYLFH